MKKALIWSIIIASIPLLSLYYATKNYSYVVLDPLKTNYLFYGYLDLWEFIFKGTFVFFIYLFLAPFTYFLITFTISTIFIQKIRNKITYVCLILLLIIVLGNLIIKPILSEYFLNKLKKGNITWDNINFMKKYKNEAYIKYLLKAYYNDKNINTTKPYQDAIDGPLIYAISIFAKKTNLNDLIYILLHYPNDHYLENTLSAVKRVNNKSAIPYLLDAIKKNKSLKIKENAIKCIAISSSSDLKEAINAIPIIYEYFEEINFQIDLNKKGLYIKIFKSPLGKSKYFQKIIKKIKENNQDNIKMILPLFDLKNSD